MSSQYSGVVVGLWSYGGHRYEVNTASWAALMSMASCSARLWWSIKQVEQRMKRFAWFDITKTRARDQIDGCFGWLTSHALYCDQWFRSQQRCHHPRRSPIHSDHMATAHARPACMRSIAMPAQSHAIMQSCRALMVGVANRRQYSWRLLPIPSCTKWHRPAASIVGWNGAIPALHPTCADHST
jgi:hypothetical protein